MKKKMLAMLLALALLATSAATALAAAPKIAETDYEGNGVVEVDFASGRVQYRNAKLVVKDEAGRTCRATILEKDNDDFSFRLKDPKAGAKYTFVISGVRAGRSGGFGRVKGSFRVPSDRPEIRKVTYDPEDRELEVEFATRVQFRNLKVTVKDADGRPLTVTRTERGNDDLELRLKGVVPGARYTVTVSGVRVRGKGGYTTVSGAFVA